MSDSTPATSTQRNPDASFDTCWSNAVLPTPASPRSTRTSQLPDRTVETRPRSVSHSLARPRRRIPRPWLDIGSTASVCRQNPTGSLRTKRGYADLDHGDSERQLALHERDRLVERCPCVKNEVDRGVLVPDRHA